MTDTEQLRQLLDRVEAYTAKATEGPWAYDDRNSAVIEQNSGGKEWIVQSWSKQERSFIDERENGEFIANSRTDLPALCAALRELLAENERLERFKTLYEAGVKAWNPVYEVVLNERDSLREQMAGAIKTMLQHYTAAQIEAAQKAGEG